jgi:hypothetical protein
MNHDGVLILSTYTSVYAHPESSLAPRIDRTLTSICRFSNRSPASLCVHVSVKESQGIDSKRTLPPVFFAFACFSLGAQCKFCLIGCRSSHAWNHIRARDFWTYACSALRSVRRILSFRASPSCRHRSVMIESAEKRACCEAFTFIIHVICSLEK